MALITISVQFDRFAPVDVRCDDRLSLREVVNTLSARALVPPTAALVTCFRSRLSGRMVSALRPLVEERCVSGDLLHGIDPVAKGPETAKETVQ